jgi:hypothetical protein
MHDNNRSVCLWDHLSCLVLIPYHNSSCCRWFHNMCMLSLVFQETLTSLRRGIEAAWNWEALESSRTTVVKPKRPVVHIIKTRFIVKHNSTQHFSFWNLRTPDQYATNYGEWSRAHVRTLELIQVRARKYWRCTMYQSSHALILPRTATSLSHLRANPAPLTIACSHLLLYSFAGLTKMCIDRRY